MTEATETREVLSATGKLAEIRASIQEVSPWPVAIYYGLELNLPSGGSAALLVIIGPGGRVPVFPALLFSADRPPDEGLGLGAVSG